MFGVFVAFSWFFRGFFVAPVLGKIYVYSPWNSLLIKSLKGRGRLFTFLGGGGSKMSFWDFNMLSGLRGSVAGPGDCNTSFVMLDLHRTILRGDLNAGERHSGVTGDDSTVLLPGFAHLSTVLGDLSAGFSRRTKTDKRINQNSCRKLFQLSPRQKFYMNYSSLISFLCNGRAYTVVVQ